MTPACGPAGLGDDLALGRRELGARFRAAPPRAQRAGELLAATADPGNAVYRLRAGWACQFRDLSDGRQAIVDVYLPGDVVGLDSVLCTRPLAQVVTLTSVVVESIEEQNLLSDLMSFRPTALYTAWLLSQRQRRADGLLAAISCLDARGRLAAMMLDFFERLRAENLISTATYNLPLKQSQIGDYLGLTVVHVNRVLRCLRDDRIVNLERHCVTILDLERLTGLARNTRIAGSTPQFDRPAPGQPEPFGIDAMEKTA